MRSESSVRNSIKCINMIIETLSIPFHIKSVPLEEIFSQNEGEE